MVVVFGSAQEHYIYIYACPHKLGHSFGLPHTFEVNIHYYTFHRGLTENYMDYLQADDGRPNPFFKESKSVFTFYKWQWDIMRNDKSMK